VKYPLPDVRAARFNGLWTGTRCQMQRVFGIGLNKTGTTSLYRAVQMLGLRALHHGPRIEANLDKAVRRGAPLFRYSRPRVRFAHAFFDLAPIMHNFEFVHGQFPGARFILSTRDLDAWLDSRERHVRRNQERAAAGEYAGTFLVIDRERWTEQWTTHHQRVETYFRHHESDLLTMDVTAGEGWEQLAPFLGVEAPQQPFPFLNRA
jgi:hypothetical protein